MSNFVARLAGEAVAAVVMLSSNVVDMVRSAVGLERLFL
jgi:hypothetical protein